MQLKVCFVHIKARTTSLYIFLSLIINVTILHVQDILHDFNQTENMSKKSNKL